MSTQQSGLVSGNKQNAPGGATKNNRSKFPLSFSQFQTERFAEYMPFFVQEGVDTDDLPLHSNHEVQTYTLKSPILQSLTKKKDYFSVPMQAILPLNWDKFYTNPNIGQDVPVDCGLGVADFWTNLRSLFIASWNTLPANVTSPETESSVLEKWLRFMLFFEMIYSAGSLMETLGTSGHNWCNVFYDDGANVQRYTGYDEMFDDFMRSLEILLAGGASSRAITLQIGTDTYLIKAAPDDRGSGSFISLRQALELMRDDLTFTISGVSLGTGGPIDSLVSSFKQEWDPVTYMPTSDAPYNLGRLWAYQLVVAHFYSNDHVDYIYSAELFRQYVHELAVPGRTSGTPSEFYARTFVVNGFEYEYDSMSAYYFNYIVSSFHATKGIFQAVSPTYKPLSEMYAYFTALFSFKRSLRFMDYFTGSRSLPLAIGDHEVAVNSNNKVDVIELSRASMMTRFLQAVNRSGRKFSNYMKELFGRAPAYDYHNPMFLAHTSDLVGSPETENTGAAQVDPTRSIAVTSRLRATSSRWAFKFSPDRDCIVIGITYYDLPRVYTRATERQNFVLDRFDMFNPYLEFIGDQPVYQAEIGTRNPIVDTNQPFSYTNRHMEYKQRYNQANGGFCVKSTGLDHWIFSADELRRNFFSHISPSFIRSFNGEIDKFYQNLTGYSLGTYFHFIVRYDNRMDASRPMAYNPVISV